jgi:hypothetical protein
MAAQVLCHLFLAHKFSTLVVVVVVAGLVKIQQARAD